MAKISFKGMSPEKKAHVKSERAANNVIKSMLVIARRGRPLSEAQKAQIVAALGAALEDLKTTLSAPKGEAKKKFVLAAETAAPAPTASDVILRKAGSK